MSYSKIKADIIGGKYAPIYFFYGEESFYIDKLTRLLETQVLDEGMRSFNQDVVYGSEMTGGKILSLVRSYPVMSNYRVVMFKEAQKLKKDEWEKLVTYFKEPAPTTILVIAYKDKKPDGRTKFASSLLSNKSVVSLECKPLYENKMGEFIHNLLKEYDLEADADAVQMLIDAYGTNLSLIDKEIEKLQIQLQFYKKKRITQAFLYDYINLDREFNIYELEDAVAQRNVFKAHQVMDHMTRTPKENPPVVIVSQLYKLFSKLALCKYKNAEHENDIATVLSIHPFVARKFKVGLRNYSQTRMRDNIMYIAEADMKIKGVNSGWMDNEHHMKTLLNQLIR
jgi:DNA polymerase III subunit delta